jgi:uncharacterized protein
MNFPCTSCGACCRHLPAASPLNVGDGICRHLDPHDQRCAVYEQRPLICRVDELYRERLSTRLSARVYYLVQAQGCVTLDASNADVPAEVMRRLAQDEGGPAPLPLSDQELEEGLVAVMTEAAPLIARM